jgi:hypothetical protein
MPFGADRDLGRNLQSLRHNLLASGGSIAKSSGMPPGHTCPASDELEIVS